RNTLLLLKLRRPPESTPFPYTTLFRSHTGIAALAPIVVQVAESDPVAQAIIERGCDELALMVEVTTRQLQLGNDVLVVPVGSLGDRKSTRLNSSHVKIS